ncbi:MAG: hypothetical protein IKC34_02310 [Clostridia bacterium]|nr:hypothetical protein [Clostridia bacterium]
MKKTKNLDENSVRVIKIGKEALFEFIYESFIADQKLFFDVDPLDVVDYFDINLESGEFIFCVSKSEDSNGKFLRLPKEIDLKNLMRNLPDTTDSMFVPEKTRYKEFTKEELVELSKK